MEWTPISRKLRIFLLAGCWDQTFYFLIQMDKREIDLVKDIFHVTQYP
jgi:hypothetical protein